MKRLILDILAGRDQVRFHQIAEAPRVPDAQCFNNQTPN